MRDGLQYYGAPTGCGGNGAVVGQQQRTVLTAIVRTLGSCRVVGGRREQGERAQAGVGDLAKSGRRAFHGTQEQAVGLDDLAGARDGGGCQRGCRGVGVGEDSGGRVQRGQVQVGRGDGGGLVEEFLQMLAELAVVEPDHQAQTGVEAAGGQGCVDVGLIVVVDQSQCGGVGDSGVDQRFLVGLGCFEDPGGLVLWLTFSAGCAGRPCHDRLHAAQQCGGPRPPAGTTPRTGAGPGGRNDDCHTLAVDRPQFGGEALGERVVAADDHVAARNRLVSLMGKRGAVARNALSAVLVVVAHVSLFPARRCPSFTILRRSGPADCPV